MPLTAKKEAFCRAYVANGSNGTQAAITAGYSKKTARSQAQRLLTNVDIQKRIAELKEPINKGLAINAEYVRERLKIEAERDGEGASHSARIRALELLGKDVGMFEGREWNEEEQDSITVNRIDRGKRSY